MKNSLRSDYNSKVTQMSILVVLAHTPVFLWMAYYYKTEYWLAMLSPLTIAGLAYLGHMTYRGARFNLNILGVGLMLLSATMIHLGKGKPEFHFHIFAILGLTYLYGYKLPLVLAALTIAVHHLGLFYFKPESLLNYDITFQTVLIHATFVVGQTVIGLGIVKQFSRFIDIQNKILPKLDKVIEDTYALGSNMKKYSDEYSANSTEQAAAVQETVATLSEITAMVNKNTENVVNSTELTGKSFDLGSSSLQAMKEMVSSITEIDQSNNLVLEQVKVNNEQIANIAQVIQEIAEKTKVINDIVFQTRLLSFNASVEAARAGEHGKGFAVVAEEVGNLASMSGTAAQEIESMLKDSTHKVTQILEDSTQKITKLTDEGKSKLETGKAIASRCAELIKNVVHNIEVINKNMENISQAAKEESQGVSNISDAMNELDQAAHANSNSARETNEMSSQLIEQVNTLKEIVNSMRMNSKESEKLMKEIEVQDEDVFEDSIKRAA